ncbi:hypothetical protein BPTFM16_01879 [Altererythrobacter insulae]|nr:hypothetical protein BPTFM16_01879 [Altererythrobacter insulae]
MNNKPNDLLLLAGKILTVLMQAFMAIGAVALTIALPIVIFMQDKIDAEIAAEYGNTVGELPMMALAGVIVLALAAVALIFVFFGKLRAIISTVGDGDPFEPANADRLNFMAWLLLAVQVIAIPIGGLALLLAKWVEPMENSEFTVDAGFDLTGILLVIILFILARVFKHGAAMREDLEGTV